MRAKLDSLALPLFVPADRPDRYRKVFASGADAAIIDLEDAVALDKKDVARQALEAAQAILAEASLPVLVRINAVGTVPHAADVALVAWLPITAVILPKAESAADVETLAAATGRPVLALIESAGGLAAARAVAQAGARLVFGSIDFCADLGCAHSREALLPARFELVLASRLAGRPGPLDGVTTAVKEAALVEDDARYAASLGFAGKLLIHPAQVGPARAGFRPTAEQVRWAERILAAGTEGGAAAVDGAMVDAPVRLRAEQILAREAALAPDPES